MWHLGGNFHTSIAAISALLRLKRRSNWVRVAHARRRQVNVSLGHETTPHWMTTKKRTIQ
jgi:hypothetical protein